MQKVKSLSTVIFVMGLPRSGKTFLGKHLSSALGATHISSDRVRKALQTKGKYQSKDKDDVYHEMKKLLKNGLQNNENVTLPDDSFCHECSLITRISSSS
jgi:predicted kinase